MTWKFPIPNTASDDTPNVCLKINEKWVSFLVGALEKFTELNTWDETTGDQQEAVDQTRRLMLALAEGNIMCSAPVGTVLIFAGTTLPDGFLWCDGDDYPPDDYPELYAAIGFTYGSIAGVTFRVPDLRQRFPVGAQAGESGFLLADVAGEKTHILTIAEIPAHDHDVVKRNNAGAFGNLSLAAGNLAGANSVTSSTTGGGSAHNNMPPYLAINYIIRAQP